MKKILLAGTALVGVAMLATPAKADLKLDLGGYFRGYGVYADNDEPSPGKSDRKFEFRHDSEVHFTGETTTDMGLTVGVHSELKLGYGGTHGFNFNPPSVVNGLQGYDFIASQTDETYVYFQGGWGRVNLGQEDGAAYLLQVAAPSADSNIDGLRPTIQMYDPGVWAGISVNSPFTVVLGYDNADFRQAEKLTYLTPKWNGFQAGVSYAPNSAPQWFSGGTQAPAVDNFTTAYDNIWDVAARWDGDFQGVGISLGGGYSHASAQNSAGAGANNWGSDDLVTWDAGLNLTWQGWSLGAGYKHSNTGTSGAQTDYRIWDVGLGWDNGPWHAGASFYDSHSENNAYGFGLPDDMDLQRWTVGGGYTYGPGMSFRGSVAWLNVDNNTTSPNDPNQFQVAIGTDVNF